MRLVLVIGLSPVSLVLWRAVPPSVLEDRCLSVSCCPAEDLLEPGSCCSIADLRGGSNARFGGSICVYQLRCHRGQLAKHRTEGHNLHKVDAMLTGEFRPERPVPLGGP